MSKQITKRDIQRDIAAGKLAVFAELRPSEELMAQRCFGKRSTYQHMLHWLNGAPQYGYELTDQMRRLWMNLNMLEIARTQSMNQALIWKLSQA